MGKLTIQEEEVIICTRELENCYVKDTVARLEQPVPPYTMVASIVKDLERKKYVKVQRVRSTYLYAPIIRESEYRRSFMSGVVRNCFENSYEEIASSFTRDQKISTNGLKEIINMIKEEEED